VEVWKKTDLECLHRVSSNYLMARGDGKNHLEYIDSLLVEAKENPDCEKCIMENNAALYYKIKEIGGLRTLNWIIKNCSLRP